MRREGEKEKISGDEIQKTLSASKDKASLSTHPIRCTPVKWVVDDFMPDCKGTHSIFLGVYIQEKEKNTKESEYYVRSIEKSTPDNHSYSRFMVVDN